MKTAYISLYFICGLLFVISILGTSLFKPMFDFISETALDASGFKKEYIESADDKIDDLVYKSGQIELQIEKLKKLFSSEKVDESKYKREKHQMLEKAFYRPLVSTLDYFFMAVFFFSSLVVLSFAVVFQVVYRSVDLRRRVKRLEGIVLAKHL